MVADYIGELFKANRSFEQMFTTKENAEKIASLLSLMRKETSDEYIRARYAEAIAKLRNAETYREPTMAVAYSRSDYDVEIKLENPNKDSYIKAKDEFGTTTRINLAGWLNVDGTMLDFSEGQGYRVQDHREIQNIYNDNSWTDALIQYLAEGNIRLQSYGFELWRKPTSQQIEILKKIIRNNNGEIVVDIDINKKGDTNSYEYEEGTPVNKIIEDINNYFDNGIEPVIDRASDYRYSRADTEYKELPAEKATAELKEGKVFNRNVGEVIYDVLSKEFETNYFRFDISKENVLKEVSKLLNLNDVESVEFNEKLEKFSKDLVKTLKIGEIVTPQVLDEKGNVVTKEKVKYKPILEYFREIDPSTTYSDIYEFVGYDIADALKQVSVFKGRDSQTTRKNLEIKKSKEIIEMKQNLLDEVSEILDSKMELIHTLKKNNVKAVKYVSQIERIKTFAKNFEKSKIFKEGSIREFAQTFYNNIKSINVNKANARGIVLNLKDAFESSLIKGEKEIINDVETYPNDVMNQEQRSYLAAVFKLLEARKNLDVPIDFSNNIENLDEFNIDMKSIQNKTEGEVIADVLRIFRKVTNEANNKKAVLNGTEYDIHELLEKEVELQNNNKRNTTKAQEGLVKTIKQVSSSFYDPQFWFNLLGNNVEHSFFNEVFKELQNAENKKLKIKYDLQKDVNDYIRKNKSVIKKINNKKNLVEIAKGKSIPLITVVDMYMTAKTDNSESHFFNKDWGGVNYKQTHITSEDIIGLLDKGDQENINSVTSENKEEIYAECKKK